MKNLLSKKIVLALSMLITMSCSDKLDEPVSNGGLNGEDHLSQIEFVDQNLALESCENLMALFKSSKTKSVNSDYPDYYGGCYIDENANLVVYVTNDSVKTKSSLLNVNDPNIIIKSCDYSFNELHTIKKTISDLLHTDANNSIAENVVYVSLRDMDNRIAVGLLDNSISEIDEFKRSIVNSPAIIFEKTEKKITPYNITDGYPGSGLVSPFGTQTLGFRASRYGKIGYVTTAHGVQYNDNVSVNGYILGRCTERQYSGSVDAAFCEEDPNQYVTYSNRINGTTLNLSSSIRNVTAGMMLYKSGNETGVTSGIVISTSTEATFTFGTTSVTLTDVIETRVDAYKGDSGAPAFYNSGWEGELVGIVAGGAYYTYLVKATNIASALGCQIY